MKKSSLGAVVLALSMNACGDGPLEEDPCQVEAILIYQGVICETDARVYGDALADYLAVPTIPTSSCESYPIEITGETEEILITRSDRNYHGTGERLDDGRIRIVENYYIYDCSQ